MNGRNHNLHHFFCALGIAFSTLGVGATVACDAMGDTDERIAEVTASSGGEEETTTGASETAGEGGCTLTQGYWKNHNVYAKNKSQQTPWPISEDTELCGETWYDNLHVAPKGDAFYIVSHQWIAASLNVAAGAAVTPEVSAALVAAEGYLADCEISKAEKADALAAKDVLDAFNNGEVGPGHCGDGDVPGFDPVPETTGGETGGETGEDCIVDCGTTTEPLPIPG